MKRQSSNRLFVLLVSPLFFTACFQVNAATWVSSSDVKARVPKFPQTQIFRLLRALTNNNNF